MPAGFSGENMGTGEDKERADILHLTSLQEVFGGFAHEIAQPLNAVMIAAQVIQLKVQQSVLLEEEKAYMVQRLNLISNQVKRASEIVESIRLFSRADRSSTKEVDLRAVLQKILGLMGQQFMGRGIELRWESAEDISLVSGNPHLIEGIVVQALAYARDAVEATNSWHEGTGILYRKSLLVQLANLDACARLRLTWDRGEFPQGRLPVDANTRRGLLAADSILSTTGGLLEFSDDSLGLTFGKK